MPAGLKPDAPGTANLNLDMKTLLKRERKNGNDSS
jgi:hypothetical protein